MSDKYKPDRPVFCGNFEYDANPRDVERLFDRFGPIERLDMKTGFAFVFMKDRRDGDDAIRALDGQEFGVRRRRLRVEWAKGDGEVKKREDVRRKVTAANETLFVVNFDPDQCRERDLERHFGEYGRLRRVQIKRNYGFVQYEKVEDATEALRACNHSRLMGRTITVEYVAREADGRPLEDELRRPAPRRSPTPPPRRRRRRRDSFSPDDRDRRRRSRSPEERDRRSRGSPERRRSPTPANRDERMDERDPSPRQNSHSPSTEPMQGTENGREASV
eukprot:jgi/Astpho2/6920/Aster-01787